MARAAPSGSPGVGWGAAPRTRGAVAPAECQLNCYPSGRQDVGTAQVGACIQTQWEKEVQEPQKVFISHAQEDNARCRPLLDLFDRWGVAYWFSVESIQPGSELSDEIQQALRECDVFLRVCTTAAQRSYWMRLESGADSWPQLAW